jgi:hypothetical protein
MTEKGRVLFSIPGNSNVTTPDGSTLKVEGFTPEDLISFGNYLLSDQRINLIMTHPENKTPEDKIDALGSVSHADFQNWLETNPEYTSK